MNKEEAKEKLKELVEKFKQKEKEYKSLSEPDVETKLVRELFVEILGWTNDDFFQQTKVARGDKRGRADYEFRIGDKRVFFLEVKKINIPLEKEADKQVVSYALSKKNVPFAISTNFKQLKVFCVEQENAINQVFRVFLEPEEYLSKFEDLWLLSKESFLKNSLLKQAEKEQRLKKRVSIDKYLLEDLMYIRKLISDDIEKRYSNKYDINEKDEIVQRILDRLIFIRRCEDVGINPKEEMLSDLISCSEDRAYFKLKETFKLYDDKYNSGLFAIGKDNDCDKITISGKIIKNLIELLYQSRDKQYYYNFDWIDADVLGGVYEQYLGKILQQTKSGKAKLKEGQAHRKEQGIYYTPTYIVDYIIKNTLGEKIKENRKNTKNLKVLDPACGSGSFLIKAFDYIYNEVKDEGKNQRDLSTIDNLGFYSKKTEILKNNLFGVDLDNKAVEITKLNLLLKAAEKNRKLPEELDLHIKKGNSLIDDDNITKDYFKWEGDFQEGTFDVVIGNPPYVFGGNSGIKIEEKKFFKDFYYSGKN
ncbi:MAG: N-6 DNA methylase, partial [Nanoarchaeota archaeon]